MPETFVITVPAEKLQEAVRTAVPAGYKRMWRKRSWPVSLTLDRRRRTFCVAEAQHELAAYEMPCVGRWPRLVQLDGRAFRVAIESYPSHELLELTAYPDRITIKNGRSVLSLPRLDSTGAEPIKPKPIPRDRRHKGKPKVVEEPFVGRVELDHTWDFSARMPVPHHRYPDGVIPPGEDGRYEVQNPPPSKVGSAGATDLEELRASAERAVQFFSTFRA